MLLLKWLIGESWTELLIALSHLTRSTEPTQRTAAFRVFATTPDIIEKEHEQAVLGVFQNGFKDPDLSVWWWPLENQLF